MILSPNGWKIPHKRYKMERFNLQKTQMRDPKMAQRKQKKKTNTWQCENRGFHPTLIKLGCYWSSSGRKRALGDRLFPPNGFLGTQIGPRMINLTFFFFLLFAPHNFPPPKTTTNASSLLAFVGALLVLATFALASLPLHHLSPRFGLHILHKQNKKWVSQASLSLATVRLNIAPSPNKRLFQITF